MQIGPYQISILDASRFRLDGGAMFGVVPKVLWEKKKAPDEQNRIRMGTNLLLLRHPQRTILVDTGMGTPPGEKFAAMYAVEYPQYTLEKALSANGLTAEDITDVILTHLHFDHAGGVSDLDDSGERRLKFPKATYYLQQKHLDWALAPSAKDRASFIGDQFAPLPDSGQLKLVDGEAELMPGVRVIPVNGHTVAQQAVLVSDQQSTLFYPADLIPTSAHVPLPWVMAYDIHPLDTIREKASFLQRAAHEKWRVVFEHDPEVPVASVCRTERGYALEEKS